MDIEPEGTVVVPVATTVAVRVPINTDDGIPVVAPMFVVEVVIVTVAKVPVLLAEAGGPMLEAVKLEGMEVAPAVAAGSVLLV